MQQKHTLVEDEWNSSHFFADCNLAINKATVSDIYTNTGKPNSSNILMLLSFILPTDLQYNTFVFNVMTFNNH
jgi:hypothetical protein